MGDDVRGNDGGACLTWILARLVVKIPTVNFTDVTLAIDDNHGDDVRCGDWGDGHGG